MALPRALDVNANNTLRRNMAGTAVMIADAHTQRVGLVDDEAEMLAVSACAARGVRANPKTVETRRTSGPR